MPTSPTLVVSDAKTESKGQSNEQRQRVSNGQHSSDLDTQSSHSTHVTSGLSTNHESDETTSNGNSELEKSYENTQNQSQDSMYTARMNDSSCHASDASSSGRYPSLESRGADRRG